MRNLFAILIAFLMLFGFSAFVLDNQQQVLADPEDHGLQDLSQTVIEPTSVTQLAMTISQGTWQVAEVTGTSRILSGPAATNVWKPATKGSQIKDIGGIKTGTDGWVVLTRNKDSVIIAPSSIIEVQPATFVGTQFFQRAGKATFDVDRRPGRRFEVHF